MRTGGARQRHRLRPALRRGPKPARARSGAGGKRRSIRRARRFWAATARRVSTTEHVLSALLAMGVTNAEIFVEGPEIPIGRRQRARFVAAIEEAGLQAQRRPACDHRAAGTVRRAGCGPYDRAYCPRRCFACASSPIFRRRSERNTSTARSSRSVYREEIAGARTFGYLHEVEALRARGLGARREARTTR